MLQSECYDADTSDSIVVVHDMPGGFASSLTIDTNYNCAHWRCAPAGGTPGAVKPDYVVEAEWPCL